MEVLRVTEICKVKRKQAIRSDARRVLVPRRLPSERYMT